MIPLVDLSAQYRSIKDEIDGAIQSTLDQAQFINGHDVAEFEKNFAEIFHQFCQSYRTRSSYLYIYFSYLRFFQIFV